MLQVAVIVPLADRLPAPAAGSAAAAGHAQRRRRASRKVLGWNPNVVFALIAFASFLCCVTMSMPQQHLVALCTDLGISATIGAAMLSVLLGAGLLQPPGLGLGVRPDRRLAHRAAELGAAGGGDDGFLFTQDEVGLFTVSAAFGIGFSALIPAYVLAIRELFPVSEAYWRVPTLLLLSGSGMAIGGWLAGYLYDMYGYYAPAFATGVAFNIVNHRDAVHAGGAAAHA